jgi:tRNA G18 (ribose-2'-O)-methylase SpoU
MSMNRSLKPVFRSNTISSRFLRNKRSGTLHVCTMPSIEADAAAARPSAAQDGAPTSNPIEQQQRPPPHAAAAQPPDAAAASTRASAAANDGPKCFVIVYNIAKKHNIGTLLRSCTAFGVAAVCLVGSRQFNTFGSHGSSEYVDMRHFATIDECCDWLRDEQGATLTSRGG